MDIPKAGAIEDGHYFKGGDPGKKANWISVPAVGEMENGHYYLGGDPAKQESWKKAEERGTISGLINSVDKYTGAPVRKAISEGLKTKDPMAALKAGKEQFGAATELAPSQSELAGELGADTKPFILTAEQQKINDQINNPGMAISMKQTGKQYTDKQLASKADILGVPLGVATDPTTYLGPMAAKGLVGAGESVLNKTVQGGTKALKYIEEPGLVKNVMGNFDTGRGVLKSVKMIKQAAEDSPKVAKLLNKISGEGEVFDPFTKRVRTVKRPISLDKSAVVKLAKDPKGAVLIQGLLKELNEQGLLSNEEQ